MEKAIESLACGWLEFRHDLCAGRIPGYILNQNNQLVLVPNSDWASPKNENAAESGRAVVLKRAPLGGRDKEGYVVVKATDLEALKKQRSGTAPKLTNQSKRLRKRGRRAYAKEAAFKALKALYSEQDSEQISEQISTKPLKTIMAEVNNYLIQNGDKPISEDTVGRAVNELCRQ